MERLRMLAIGGLLAAAALTLAACNTVKGVGRDISGSAEYVQEQMFY
jgi:predicted small secreted protein